MKTISNSKDAYEAVKDFVKHPEQEELFVICMNHANGVKDIHFIGLGSDEAVIICTKLIAKQAILDMASGIILVHTHPSGNPKPSTADIKETEKLRDALKFFDIRFVDHIIIGNKCFFSFNDDTVTNVE